MIRLQQPTPNSCGQTCAAMVLGLPVDVVMQELPDRKSGTPHKKLITYLKSRGVVCDDRLRLWRHIPQGGIPWRALIRIVWPDGNGHLVLRWDGVYYDPWTDIYQAWWRDGGRITSYLRIA